MSNGWEQHHRRIRVLREVMEQLERQRLPHLPWNERTAAAFETSDDLLAALHQRWLTRLSTRIDVALELDDSGPGHETVTRAWRETERAAPGLRRLLDRHSGAPPLRHGEETERRLLRLAAGPSEPADQQTHSTLRAAI